MDAYKRAIAACASPAGYFINNQAGGFTFVHVAEPEKNDLSGLNEEAAELAARIARNFEELGV